ncbi:MAG: nicotinate-nucleotide--dimethylbenzimidazole phosphoribosyltransferase [Cellulosilyticaceae bacterium]
METLKSYIEQITPSDKAIKNQMEAYIDGLSKPVGSLGKLEEMVTKLASIYGNKPIDLNKKIMVIMCSDNGVCEENISECPQEVTAQVTYNFTKGLTAINRFSAFTNSDIHIVDIGVKSEVIHPLVHNKKILHGTHNMAREAAMTYEEAIRGILVGISTVEELIKEGYNVFGTGEMGIGNTTTSAAVISVLTQNPVQEVVGKGSGARPETLQRKIETIEKAIEHNKPNPEDPIDILAKVGGLDLAGLCGVFLGAAKNKKPVVIDGIISSCAALLAYRLAPLCGDYMFPSHLSKEIGSKIVFEALGIEPYFELNMRLGEGTGCPITFQLMEMATFVLSTMGTFEDAHVDKDNYMNIWK